MYLTWQDLLTLWMPWPQIILILVTLGIIYGLGWRRLRKRGSTRLANGWRLAAFMTGLVALGLAMLSAIEVLHDTLFTLHMVQHLLIMMVGAPLIMLADPFPFLMWGLPKNARETAALLLVPRSSLRRVLERLGKPWLVWGLYVGTQWLWHMPGFYDAALRSEVLHVLEHVAFFLTALLFWWHATGAAPRIYGRLGYGFRIVYCLAAMAQNEILGIIISFTQQPLYTYYTTVPRLWGISVMEDQTLGGAIMWVPGGMMYAVAAIALLASLLEREERKTAHMIAEQLGSSEQATPAEQTAP
jgi:putative membrane protein